MADTLERSPDEKFAAILSSDPAAIADPYPVYAAMRERGRAYELGPTVYLTRYDDVRTLIRDAKRFSSRHGEFGTRAEAVRARMTDPEHQRAYDEVMAFEADFLNRCDAPRQTLLRRRVHAVFTPRRVQELELAIEGYAEELLAPLEPGQTIDFMGFAHDFPLMVISDLLDVPPSERGRVPPWSRALTRNRHGVDLEPLLEAHQAWVEFREYAQERIAAHRRSPGSAGPLVFALLQRSDGDSADDDESVERAITAIFVMLLEAGHETTSSLLSSGLLELLRARDQWRALVDDPTLIANGVEELLRYVAPSQGSNRVAAVDTEIAGVEVAAGQTIVGLLASANRDPTIFPEPETLDVRRLEAKQHLSFSIGPHYCLGQALARFEAATMFRHLTRRFPEMELVDSEVEWRGAWSLRQPAELRINLGPAGHS
jgi:cytochrome P450